MNANKQTRFTNQKMAIWEYLKSAKTHPPAEEIYNQVRKALPRITLATVYRNLKEMYSKGLFKKSPTKF